MSSSVTTANSIPDHNISELYQRVNETKLCDKYRLKKRLHNTQKITDVSKREKALAQIAKAITSSVENKALKRARVPKITYPESLPVSQNVELISKTIAENQVVIIAGETGSGKTTQIPKICLALGRGIEGIIGHTQPRRIAARTVATRIAEELSTKLGDSIGYKVRFTDQVSETSHVKLMTDGILLAEMQNDRLLRQYDTIIIDEAHERSLNIDFILGYIKKILPKRPDLKVIITSATIDPERFSHHFDNAPIIEVSGRTYPVDMVYRPLSDSTEDQDIISGILSAVDELDDYAPGDILIFLNGEREIRDTATALEKANLRHTQILPLYSRLTVQEQNRIFMPHSGRNIVLATNVAETSLTVPGIKYVIDPGTARISRYSYRTKVQRLPIEPISQASANQRAGRCGRVSAGVCIRLYAQDDFNNRPEFTDPEILRTNLATVILQMLALDLGAIADFPFVQPPDNRNINDGVKLLEELAAISPQKNNQIALTKTGRLLSKFPTDPRLSKMILGAIDNGCVKEVFIIVAALSIQDPRERPHEKQQAADEKHNRFKDKQSDFVSFLNLWCYVKQQQKALSSGQFRKLCQKEFLSYMRLREWQDIYNQLTQTLKDQNITLSTMNYDFDMEAHAIEQAKGNRNTHQGNTDKSNTENSTESSTQNNKGSQFDILHQSILSGLLSHLGQLDDNKEYKGARGSKFFIFPGSGIARKPPKWLMAAELVETSRLFARMAARIDPLWIEPLAEHLVKRNYSEPHWEKKQGAVIAFEQVSLYGMTIVPKRKVNFNAIEPHTCREIFIREALVAGDCTINEAFFQENKKLVASIEALEQKARRKDFLIEEEHLVAFYDKHLPDEAVCQRSFLSWWKTTKKASPKLLHFTREFLLNESSETLDAKSYPDTWQQGLITLPLSYHFTPGDIDDGISVIIPIGLLNQVDNVGFDWLIPAMHQELIMALIRGLPKNIRRNFVPAPNYAEACLAAFSGDETPSKPLALVEAIAKQLLRMTGVRIPEDIWPTIELPVHLTMNFKVVSDNGKLLKEGRNLEELREKLQSNVKSTIKKVAEKGIERHNITQWDIGSLPIGYEKKVANITIKAFPALVDHKSNVAIELFEDEALAHQSMLKGVSRLVLLSIPSPIKYLQEKLPNKAKLGLYFNPFGSINELLQDCIQAACEHLIQSYSQNGSQNSTQSNENLPRTEAEFIKVKEHIRAEIADTVLNGAIKLEQILSLTHDIRKTMKKRLDLSVVQAHGDMKGQLDALIFKGFLATSGYKRLDDLQRYLKAIARRLEKLSTDTNQDRLKMLEVEKVEDAYKKLSGEYRAGKVIPDNVNETRWMIEELRVSLFAQNLKTPYPISTKRVLNHIKTLK